jgi:hypothetical protein
MEIKNCIWKDNQSFLKDRAVFHEQFLEFVWGIISKEHDGPRDNKALVKTFVFSLDFCLNVVFHWSKRDVVQSWTDSVINTIKKMAGSCATLIVPVLNNKDLMRSILLQCNVDVVRMSLVSILYAILEFQAKKTREEQIEQESN